MVAKKEVVSWKEQMAAAAHELVELERPAQTSSITTRSGVLKYMGEKVPDNKLSCIIIANVFENAYYPEKYDPDNPQPPSCFAFSTTGQDMEPHTASADKQNKDCVSCPQNKFSKDGGKWLPKPCKNIRRLMLIPADAVKGGAEGIPGCEMVTMKIPVTSGKIFSQYVKKIAVGQERPLWGVLTEISLEPHEKHQFHVNFELQGLVNDDAVLGAISARIGEAREQLMTPYEPPTLVEESKKY